MAGNRDFLVATLDVRGSGYSGDSFKHAVYKELGTYETQDTLKVIRYLLTGKSNYRISANSFRGNYSFLNLTLCTVTFGDSTYRCRNYSREETRGCLKNK